MARSLTPFEWGSLAPRGAFGAESFSALHREMDRLFDSFLRDYGVPGLASAEGSSLMAAPKIDVSETDREIRIEAELPGVKEDDIEVELADDLLTIRGEKKAERQEGQKGYHMKERTYGSFSRAMRLPFSADPEQIKASFDSGVLTVTVAKPHEAKGQARKIEIGGGATRQTGSESAGKSQSATSKPQA
jgi:HSP20 family protein